VSCGQQTQVLTHSTNQMQISFYSLVQVACAYFDLGLKTKLDFLHHKFHVSQYNNNSHVKFSFHRFIRNRHGCHSSTFIV
jgi:hypothetical protein